MKPKDSESGHITSAGDDHAQTIVQPLIGAVEDFIRVHGFLREDGRARGGGRNGDSGISVRFEE